MRKIYKISINIAVIFTLIAAWQGFAYAGSMSLRAPLYFNKEKQEKLIIDRGTGKITGRFLTLSRLNFKKLNSVTIKNFRLDHSGSLQIGGRQRAHFRKYRNHQIEIDVDRGVITEVRIYDEAGNLIKEDDSSDPDEKSGHRKFFIIVDRDTDEYEDSFQEIVMSARFKKFHNKTIKNFRLDRTGTLQVGGRNRPWVYLEKYRNHQIEIDIDHGLVTEVRIYDDEGMLIKEEDSPNPDEKSGHRKFALIADRDTGEYKDSFYKTLMPDRFRELNSVTIKNFRLDHSGSLQIGGRLWAKFSGYRDHLAEIDIDHGVVIEVRIYDEDGRLIKEKYSPNPDEKSGHRKFVIIADRDTGEYKDSFYKALMPDRFRELNNVTIKNFWLNSVGTLKIGGRKWTKFTLYPNHQIEIDVDQGVISEVRIYDEDMKVADYYLFKIVTDEDTGEAITSFRNNYIPNKTWDMIREKHKAKVAWVNLPEWNVIKLNNAVHSEYFDFTSIGDFAGKDIMIYFENGEVSKFEINQGEDKVITILPDDIKKQSGWFSIFWQKPHGFESDGIVPVVDGREVTEVTLEINMLKEEISTVIERLGYYDSETWWEILLDLGETNDTEDRTAEEIVAERHDVALSDIFKVIRALSKNEKVREFLLEGSLVREAGARAKAMQTGKVSLEASL